MNRSRLALALAGLQASDLAVTQVARKYGDTHLDHLGVPIAVRPVLPAIKAAAVVALVMTSKRRALRSVVGAALVSYYGAAATFHVLSGDAPAQVLPAAACAVLAGALV